MSVRRVILKIHLYVGLAAAPILLCAALTGAVLVVRPELDRWLHPGLYRVAPRAIRPSERELLTRVLSEAVPGGDPASVEAIELAGDREAQVFELRSGARLFVDPWTGAVLGRRAGLSRLEVFLGNVLQLHERLLAGNVGEWCTIGATMLLLLLLPSGVTLWWNKKRLGIRRGVTWRQVNWDLHNVTGIFASVTLLVLAASGVLLGWEQPLYWMVGAAPERERPVPHSAPPAAAAGGSAAPAPAAVPDVDAWLAAADRALPGEVTYQLVMPANAASAARITKHGPGGLGRSTVFVDRYDARVLRVDDIVGGPRAYRAHIWVRALHTGDVLGVPTRWLMALSSLALAALTVTGFILWLKRIVR